MTATKQRWLQDRAAAVSRKAKATTCSACGASVLVGPDHHRCYRIVTVDATPVDRLTETVELLRRGDDESYWLIAGALSERNQWNRTGDDRWPIHLAHRCN